MEQIYKGIYRDGVVFPDGVGDKGREIVSRCLRINPD